MAVSKKTPVKKKKTANPKTPRGCLTPAQLKRHLAKAQAEVATLLNSQRAGGLTPGDLQSALKEIEKNLLAMHPFDCDWYSKP